MTTATEDPMFSSRTDHELLSWYNSNVAKAILMGMDIVPVKEFADRPPLVEACTNLHNDMVLLAASKQAAAAEATQQPKKARPKKAKPEKPAEPEKPADPPEATQSRTEPATKASHSETAKPRRAAAKKETKPMATTATAVAEAPRKGRKAAQPAPVPAKGQKAAKATKAPASAPAKEPRRTDFDDNAKITWLIPKGEPIPGAREGSAKHARWEQIRAHNGKKVSVYRANDGNMTSLANAVEKGAASVG